MALKQYYDLYDEENLELLKQSKDKRNALAQTVKDTINANAQDTIQQIESAGEASIKDAEHAYDDVINIANVQRLVDERAVSEAMANMGMTDSGLNRTQQTAVQLSASRKIAEAQIARQKQIDALALQIRQNILDVEKQRSADLAEAETSRQADIMGIEDTYNTNRNKFATDMYEQTQKAAQDQAKADKEKTEAEAEALKDKAKARDNLLKILYATNELGNSANSDEYKQQAALSFYNQYGTDPIIDSYMNSMGWEIPKTTTKEDSLSASTETMVKELGRPELQTERYQKQSIAGKIKEWLEAGVIDDEQATYLLRLYGIPEDIFN
jgi:hypothetical protein